MYYIYLKDANYDCPAASYIASANVADGALYIHGM